MQCLKQAQCSQAHTTFLPRNLQRRALGPSDVAIKIHYCGVCHSDIHRIHGDWGKIQYPQIVGHELAGEVVAIGSSVSKFDVDRSPRRCCCRDAVVGPPQAGIGCRREHRFIARRRHTEFHLRIYGMDCFSRSANECVRAFCLGRSGCRSRTLAHRS
ncbi:MAG: hypothetical protein DMG60_19770 [Acidobacteria bacterium]|nr:MAG: hypothetical protein DMG60_19770 [Acidobacteriota bacterium]